MQVQPGKSTGWALALVFGALILATVAGWMALADDIYLSRLAAFIASCF